MELPCHSGQMRQLINSISLATSRRASASWKHSWRTSSSALSAASISRFRVKSRSLALRQLDLADWEDGGFSVGGGKRDRSDIAKSGDFLLAHIANNGPVPLPASHIANNGPVPLPASASRLDIPHGRFESRSATAIRATSIPLMLTGACSPGPKSTRCRYWPAPSSGSA